MKASSQFPLAMLVVALAAIPVPVFAGDQPSLGRVRTTNQVVAIAPGKTQTMLQAVVVPQPIQLVPALPGEIGGPLPGEIKRPLPNQVVRSLSGQMTKALPGQITRSLPGQTVQALPGQLVR